MFREALGQNWLAALHTPVHAYLQGPDTHQAKCASSSSTTQANSLKRGFCPGYGGTIIILYYRFTRHEHDLGILRFAAGTLMVSHFYSDLRRNARHNFYPTVPPPYARSRRGCPVPARFRNRPIIAQHDGFVKALSAWRLAYLAPLAPRHTDDTRTRPTTQT